MANLINYRTNETIRVATDNERRESMEAARFDGGAGVIKVDGVSCYVETLADDVTFAARTMGRKGGKANSPAQREQRSQPKPGAGRPRTTYTVMAYWTSAQRVIAEDVHGLPKAKRTALDAYWLHRPMRIEIIGSDGRTISASQRHGRGMLWTA